ncbi:hypothetical protein [Fibrobacter sp.]
MTYLQTSLKQLASAAAAEGSMQNSVAVIYSSDRSIRNLVTVILR